MDQLRERIGENRELFDAAEPAEGHFERFSNKLNALPQKRKQVPWMTYLKAASIAVLILLSGLWMHDYIMNRLVSKQSISLGDLSPEYREAEIYYTGIFNEKYSEIDDCTFPDDSMQKEILMKELSEMDSLFVNLQKEITLNPKDDRIINALIEHYERKLEVMNQILDQLKQLNNQELNNKNNETTTI